MPLQTILEEERYSQLTEREEAILNAGRDDVRESMDEEIGVILEHLETLNEDILQVVEDLCDDVRVMGSRYDPLELIDDKDVKKRYEDAISTLDKLNTKYVHILEELRK